MNMASQGQKNAHVGDLAGSVGGNFLESIIVKNHSVVKDGNYVIFKAPNQWDYEVPVRDLTSQYWIAEWMRHMAEKAWVTKDMLCQFASIVQQINTASAK